MGRRKRTRMAREARREEAARPRGPRAAAAGLPARPALSCRAHRVSTSAAAARTRGPGSSAASRACGRRRRRASRAPRATASRPRIAGSMSSATLLGDLLPLGHARHRLDARELDAEGLRFASPARAASSQASRPRGQVAGERVEAGLHGGLGQVLGERPGRVLLSRRPEDREATSRPRARPRASPDRRRARAAAPSSRGPARSGGRRRRNSPRFQGPVIHIAK